MVNKIIISAASIAVLLSVGACVYMHARVKASEKEAALYAAKKADLDVELENLSRKKAELESFVNFMDREAQAFDRLVKSHGEKVHEIEKGRGNSIKEAEGIISTYHDWADSPLPDGLCEHIRARCADGDGVQNGSIKAPVDSIDALQPSKGYAAYD